MIYIEFHNIRINTVADSLEVIFAHDGQWYKMEWDSVPDKLKQLYSVYLRLQGLPDDVTGYAQSEVCVGNTVIEIDLSKCSPIPHEYPIG